jgi:predicted deacetylase
VSGPRSIAVALHDVEPSTFERCALIRDWLGDHDIDRVTLLVIPAPDLHPFADRSPGLAAWLTDCAARGDAIAQHGLQHRQVRKAPACRQALARLQGGRAAEFVGLDAGETRRAVDAGRRLLRLAGVEPRGFVAPAYAYTPALHEAVGATFDWWASLGWLHRAGPTPRRPTLAPALCLGTSTGLKRAASPWLVRAGAALAGDVMRLDLHPADLDHPAHIGALEGVLRRARRRVAVTYDDLA